MLGKGMPINKKDYEDLKPYYDYQRKVAYNKEQVMNMAMNFEGRIYDQFGPVSLPEFKVHLWDKIRPEEYEDPPKDWVPKDESLRIEGEVYTNLSNFNMFTRKKLAVDN
jgi:rRNA processing protein Gar1